MPRFAEIQTALVRCLDAAPPSGEELKLSADSSQLAEVFGEMAYAKEEERSIEKLTAAQRLAFERWYK